jgi:cupin fold WbuC family metalloprotein
MNYEYIAPGVYRARQPINTFGKLEEQFLIDKLAESPLGRVRLNMHSENESSLHEMFIAVVRGSYVHPHKHIGKSESFHLIKGKLDVALFHDDGDLREVVSLRAGDAPYYRLSAPIYHTLLIRSEYILMHEVTDGPFDPQVTIKAPFAPNAEYTNEVHEYMNALIISAEVHMKAARTRHLL